MDKSNLLSPKRAVKIQTSKEFKQQQFLEKFLSFKEDSNFLNLNDEDRQKFIDQKLDEQIDLFNEISVKSNDALGILNWLEDQNGSIVVRFKNKPLFMGKMINGKIYLNNEETLFLIESNTVICYFKSLQLSLQDAFDLMIKNEFEFERYLVYSYLLKFGYRLKRFETSQFKNEFRYQKSINDKQMYQDNENLIKRPIGNCEEQEKFKKFKKSLKAIVKIKPDLSIIPLDQLITIDCPIDLTNKFDFFKFIRFKKLNKEIQNHSWQSLIDEYIQSTNDLNLYKSAFVVEEQIMDSDDLNESKDNSRSDQLCNDFLNDQPPLIGFDESLTNEQIQQRLTSYGPQLDLPDYSFDSVKLCNSESNNSTIYDYDVYLPNKKQKLPIKPDYYLKILNSSNHLNFPLFEIVKLNSEIEDRKKLLFVHCESNEFNFYQFTDIDLVN